MRATLLTRLERFLRVDAERSPMTATRVRAICALSAVFAFSQLLNLIGMTIDYGGWTLDHHVSVLSVVFVGLTVVSMRWCKAFTVYALLYTLAIALAVAISANTAGINSALLPMLVWGPFACGMIAGWRSVLVCMGSAILIVSWLYDISMDEANAAILTGREFQRFVQTSLALIVSATMAAVFSHGLRSALSQLHETAIRARHAEAAKSDFLAQMSHELRTPLNGVIGLADALAEGDLGAREQALTNTIRQSGQSLLAILNDLLDLSKIEAGKLTIENAAFDPRALVDGIEQTWREAAAARNTTLRTAIAGDLPAWLEGDEFRIRQVLNNFVSNAVKFTEDGRVSLTLHGERSGGSARLRFLVEDTGAGIPEASRASVFEPFEQGGAGIAKQYGGTGLGLPICRDLARLMGGSVALESSGDEGSVFSLTLCLPEADAPAAERSAAAACVSGLRVLVAEDNAVNRMVAAEFLRALGVEAVFAEDGAEALEAVRMGGFDAVLMDKHMPQMGGVETTHAIRALGGAEARVPIIAVTADAMSGEREALLAEGMDGFLSKPLRIDALRDALAEAASAKTAEAARAAS